MHLTAVKYTKPARSHQYPFNIPLLHSFKSLTFTSPITIFVGENGTGKSTLIEGIAAAVGSWKAKTRRGFFLRAEDFLSYTKKISKIKIEMAREIEQVERTYQNRSEYAKSLAKSPYAKSISELQRLYGEGLDVKSHGESYLEFFQARWLYPVQAFFRLMNSRFERSAMTSWNM